MNGKHDEEYPLRLIVRLAVAVMAAARRVTPREVEALHGPEGLGLGQVDAIAREEIERAARRPIDLHATCAGLALILPAEEAGAFLAELAELALVDREVSPPELETLAKIACFLGVLPAGEFPQTAD